MRAGPAGVPRPVFDFPALPLGGNRVLMQNERVVLAGYPGRFSSDLVTAAANTGKIVNIKKGQFLSPKEMEQVAAKAAGCGNKKIILTERGSSFGYNNLVADMRSIPIMQSFGYPVVFDATHSVQLPGGGGDRSSGHGEFAPVLAKAALAAGANGLFIETHPEPTKSPSDGPNMIPLGQMAGLLKRLTKVFYAAR